MKRLVVLITCHNRKEKTLTCLMHLMKAEIPSSVLMDVILLDDGSTDGTFNLVKEKFPGIEVIKGDGNLYWAGGMRKLMEYSSIRGYDYYLWLNDDTYLFKHSLVEMFKQLEQLNPDAVLAGATQDADDKAVTYGGFKRKFSWSPLHLKLVAPDRAKHVELTTINGNCVLIPNQVFQKTGNIDSHYTHGLADLDYGFMVKKCKAKLYLTKGYIGYCKRNKKAFFGKATDRLKNKMDVKNMPLDEWKYYVKKNGGMLWPYYMIAPYLKSLLNI